MSEWNPRWLACSRATGTAPEQVKGYEFIIWIGRRWREWEAETKHAGHKWPHHHEAFDLWLEVKHG